MGYIMLFAGLFISLYTGAFFYVSVKDFNYTS